MPPSSSCSLTRRGPSACAMRAPVAWEPVKNRPSIDCSSKAAPTSPVPTSATNTSFGTPASCSKRAISSPLKVAYSDGLYKHHIAGQQGRHEHVAADEPGVVPGRDIGHHAQRHMLDLLARAAVVEHLLGRHRRLHLLHEEVDAPEKAIELVARHRDRLAGLGRHDRSQRIELRLDGGAKSFDAGDTLGQGTRGPDGLRGTGGGGLGGHAGGIVSRQLRDALAGGGIGDGQHIHGSGVIRVARAAFRKSARMGASFSVPCSALWNSGCHCTALTQGPAV